MTQTFTNVIKKAAVASLLVFAASAVAQDGTIYPLDAPAEPDAITLGTGGVENQPAKESWFRQWGEPMVRNVTTATLTPYLPDPAKANGPEPFPSCLEYSVAAVWTTGTENSSSPVFCCPVWI